MSKPAEIYFIKAAAEGFRAAFGRPPQTTEWIANAYSVRSFTGDRAVIAGWEGCCAVEIVEGADSWKGTAATIADATFGAIVSRDKWRRARRAADEANDKA